MDVRERLNQVNDILSMVVHHVEDSKVNEVLAIIKAVAELRDSMQK